MISNDILRSLRYTLKTNNNGLVSIFALADAPVSAEQLVPWLKKKTKRVCALPGYCAVQFP